MKKSFLLFGFIIGLIMFHSCNPPQSAYEKAANSKKSSIRKSTNQNYTERKRSDNSNISQDDYYAYEADYYDSRYDNYDESISNNLNYEGSYSDECYNSQNEYYERNYDNREFSNLNHSSSQYRSLGSMKSEIKDLERLVREMRMNHKTYTDRDWDRVATRYYEIEEKFARSKYTHEELEVIGRLRGE